jgi:hypothetical protein
MTRKHLTPWSLMLGAYVCLGLLAVTGLLN